MIVRLRNLLDAEPARRLVQSLAGDGGARDRYPRRPRALGRELRTALVDNPAFATATMPRRLTTFTVRRLGPGMVFETPIDDTIVGEDDEPSRSDLLMTLFLSAPSDYDGGELVINVETGAQRLKMGAGDAVIYPATNYHRVETVTHGERWTADTTIQSVIRGDQERTVLSELWAVLDWMDAAPPETAHKLAAAQRSLRRARANLIRIRWSKAFLVLRDAPFGCSSEPVNLCV